jgi:acid ceramidase
MVPRIAVDLARAPGERWAELRPHVDGARRLVDSDLRDLGEARGSVAALIESYAEAFVSAGHREEIASVARIIDRPRADVLVGNLYYEVFRQLVGCTAFACDTPDGPIHARNLDWWTDDHLLALSTCVVRFSGAAAGPFEVVSWPSFIGALSGLAPGRFSISLNAVISSERPTLAGSVVLLIRQALETCRTFEQAVDLLERSPVVADCLLLVAGTRAGQMVVIERTSTRAAVREPEGGFIAVTNDYRLLDAGGVRAGNDLQATACGRFDRAVDLLTQMLPSDSAACLRILGDPAIRMEITVVSGKGREKLRVSRA